MKSERRNYQITKVLLLIYLIILTWIILFKMSLSLEDLTPYRGLNLIPFGGSVIVNGRIDWSEIFSNVIAFIPVGVYLTILGDGKTFVQKLLPIAGLSLCYEVLQFLFRLGATDITDLLGNTAGGAIGILIYLGLTRAFGGSGYLIKIVNGLAAICTLLLTVLLMLIIILN